MSTYEKKPYTMAELEWEQHIFSLDTLASMSPSSFISKVISALVLLAVGYYFLSASSSWPHSAPRLLYKLAVRVLPPQVIHTLHPVMAERIFQLGRPWTNALFSHFPSGWRQYTTPDAPNTESLPPGLQNFGSLCYQNSILQALMSMDGLKDYLCQCSRLSLAHGLHEGSIVQAFVALTDYSARYSSFPGPYAQAPSPLRIMEGTGYEEDAQEYFTAILNRLETEVEQPVAVLRVQILTHDSYPKIWTGTNPGSGVEWICNKLYDAKMHELLSAMMDRDQGFLAQIPGHPLDGQSAQSVRCLSCGDSNGYTMTQFKSITLNLTGGKSDYWLDELIDAYTEAEILTDVECENCTRLARNRGPQVAESDDSDAPPAAKKQKQKLLTSAKSKQVVVSRLPQNLVFHINRSVFTATGEVQKDNARVEFDEKLAFKSKWCIQSFCRPGDNQGTYKLKAVVTHSGNNHGTGHYVTYGRRGKDWYCFDDAIVYRYNLTDVLRVPGVFMLFYESVGVGEEPALASQSPVGQDSVDQPSASQASTKKPSASGQPLDKQRSIRPQPSVKQRSASDKPPVAQPSASQTPVVQSTACQQPTAIEDEADQVSSAETPACQQLDAPPDKSLPTADLPSDSSTDTLSLTPESSGSRHSTPDSLEHVPLSTEDK